MTDERVKAAASTVGGGTAGTAAFLAGVSALGAVEGMSAAGITSGLAAIGSVAGMAAGMAITCAAPLAVAGGVYACISGLRTTPTTR